MPPPIVLVGTLMVGFFVLGVHDAVQGVKKGAHAVEKAGSHVAEKLHLKKPAKK